MALIFNTFSPIFNCISYSSSFTQLGCFRNTKLILVGKRSAPKQLCRKYAVSPSTLQDQQYQLQVDFLDEYEEKKEKMRELVEWREGEDPMETLIFVDTIQRLGLAHHYEKEIEKIMKQHYLKSRNARFCGCLRHVALSFRLFRQRGYHITADVFNKFKGENGKFKDELKQDILGVVELYEATHLSFEGESILDEAQDFSSQILHHHLAQHDIHSEIVQMRMQHPFHRSLTKIANNNILTQVGAMNTWLSTLTELSQLEFSRGFHMHKYELLQVVKWWNDLDLNRELKMARNEPLKWYTWSMAVLEDDTRLSEQRVQLTKSIAFIYLIDDVFDLYGSLKELEIFNQAVHQWDYSAMDMLPQYMKSCYKSLLDTTNEIATSISRNHGYNPIILLKQTLDLKKNMRRTCFIPLNFKNDLSIYLSLQWASLCNAFLVEAKWLASKNLPRAEEYLGNATVSSGVHVALVHLFFLLGLHESDLRHKCTIISCVAAILRLWDDLGSAKDEHQNGRDGSYIECYMRDEPSLAFEEAREHVMEMIERKWKRLNKECFNQSSTSSRFEHAALNMARMVSVMYSYDHNHRLPLLKQYLQLMLLNPSSMEHSHAQLI